MFVRIIVLFSFFILAATPGFSEVKVVAPVSEFSKIGSHKLLKKAPKEIYISNFAVWFMTTRVDAIEANGARITRRTEFDLTEEVALKTTNQAFAYLKEQLAKQGYTVKVNDVSEVEATKTYKKFLKKGGGTAANNGGSWYDRKENKVDEKIGAFANGVPSVYLGTKANGGHYGMLAHEIAGKDGRLTLGVVMAVDFNKTVKEKKSYADGDAAININFFPQLRIFDGTTMYLGNSAFNYHTNKKVGGVIYGGPDLIQKDNSWAERVVDKDSQMTYIKMKPEAFAKNAGELMETYIDQLLAKVEEAKGS